MPGFIRKVLVVNGQTVKKGDRLAVLEAMKMEHALTAPFDGIVKQVFFKEGDRVGQDEIIVKLEAEAKKTT
ncbi:MAG: biotin/lipoyl-binding protein [Leptonema sp. (in: Bacteria)]|nr:biotin/lipoyl-binding protein [Leptonema sp. (in: bacteria)]